MSYFIKDTIILLDENDQWEFKAHRNFSSDEIPAWRPDGTKISPAHAMKEFYNTKNINRTRQPISRNLCGFLNSGKGGNILIGILDSGKVVGIGLSVLQKEHLLLSLEDCVHRFVPPVPIEFFKVRFIPVVEKEEELEDLIVGDDLSEPPSDVKQLQHQLRTSGLCWCDLHAMNRFKLGFLPGQYVVQVQIPALRPGLRTPEISRLLTILMNDVASPLLRLSWPAFTSEDGSIMVRSLNSIVKYNKEDVWTYNSYQTEEYFRNELEYLESTAESCYDKERILKLQSALPEGVVVSKVNLKSLLQHAEPLEINSIVPSKEDEIEEVEVEEEQDSSKEDESLSKVFSPLDLLYDFGNFDEGGPMCDTLVDLTLTPEVIHDNINANDQPKYISAFDDLEGIFD